VKNRPIKHRFEGVLVRALFALSAALPLDVASAVGGWMARRFGPVIASSAHKTAIRNLKMIYPEKSDEERARMLERIWDNLGRTAAELPHLPGKELPSRMQIEGVEHLTAHGKQMLFISGHFGNWELNYVISHLHNVPTTLIYRHANNPYVDNIMVKIRSTRCSNMFQKGGKGAIKMAHALKNGESIAMLIDQKMNDGIAVPFFGRDAMTAPAVAHIAMRYELPIIPARVVRVGGAHFKATIYPPLAYEITGDKEKDALAIMTAINQTLEDWIREYPEQWFWVHRRWPKEIMPA